MKSHDTRQEKSLLAEQAKTVLLEVKRLTHKRNSEIARHLGVSYRTLWGLEHGVPCSNQLLAGLKLLLELETQKRQPPRKTVEEQLAEMQHQLKEIRENRTLYPPHPSQATALNEPRPKTKRRKPSPPSGQLDDPAQQ